jgi:hypothetical protein
MHSQRWFIGLFALSACAVSTDDGSSFQTGSGSFGTDGSAGETGSQDEFGETSATGGDGDGGSGSEGSGDSGGPGTSGGSSSGGPDGDCGNGALDPGESCDGSDFGGETCATVGEFFEGQLGCTDECTLDTSACVAAECGDGVQNQDSEDCDGADLAGQTCADVGDYWMGDLACTGGCAFDTAACVAAECGDGVKNQDSEDCDGNDLAGQECTDIGYDWGPVTCTDDCSLDESQCLHCGANLDKCQTDDDCCPGLSCSGWPLFWCS